MSRDIEIFDRRLRDGEERGGVNFWLDERLKIGKEVEKWGVEIIEGGLGGCSCGSLKWVEGIGKRLSSSGVCGLGGCVKKEIDGV